MKREREARTGWAWHLLMAYRDSRKSRGRLLLFAMAIVFGIAAIVSINGFQQDLERAIDKEALTLLGADLEIKDNSPIDTSKLGFLDAYDLKEAHARDMASMVTIEGERKGTRLALIRAYGKGFPFYGKIETEPAEAADRYNEEGGALVAEDLMTQFELEVGDSIKIGRKSFPISGALIRTPGQNELSSAIATPVVIPLKELEGTDLVQKGSRVEYKRYYAFEDRKVYEEELKTLEDSLRQSGLDHETVSEEKDEMGEASQNLTGYLNLVGFIALIMGCIGVGSSVHIYMREKTASVAVLRCLGTTQGNVLRIFALQVALIGLIASLTGSVLGTFLQTWMPSIMKPFLPFTLETSISWSSIGVGGSVGIILATLFALPPLLEVAGTSPMRALNSFEGSSDKAVRKGKRRVYGIIGIAILLFAFYQTGSWLTALIFFGGLGLVILALLGIGVLLMRTARKLFSRNWSFPVRQGVANLFRPNDQTMVLILAIGLATTLISTLLLTRTMLVERVDITGGEGRPNTVLFDIQSEQHDSVRAFLEEEGMPVIQDVPIVPMQIQSIGGEEREAILSDTTNEVHDHMLEREYRVTYRDSLIETETLLRGEWVGTADPDSGPVPISVEEDVMEELDLSLGDRMSFNVQGASIEARVASVRGIEWQRVQTNFLILFPRGVLEKAPSTHAIMTRTEERHIEGNTRYRLTQRFPNISVLDLERILESLDKVMDKISFAIRFMGSFSIATGVLILIGSLVLTKYQRLRESVLLRTLGAVRKDILWIHAIEYAALGSIAAASGILLGLFASWVAALFWFEVPMVLPVVPLLITWAATLLLTMTLGLLNTRSALYYPPFMVLRRE